METLEMKEENYHAIMYGMKLAADSGTASTLFSNYKVGVGAKTGTASVPSGTANGIFVAFAPYEDPEIAVCVVVETARTATMSVLSQRLYSTNISTENPLK